MEAVHMLTEQLWGPGLGDSVRVRVTPSAEPPPSPSEGQGPDGSWHTAEEYWMLGRPRSPRLLVPMVDGDVERAALTHYRGLRRPAANAARAALGALVGAGVPLSRHRLVVRTRTRQEAALLPLPVVAAALGHERLHATFGVRTGANRKATLHLIAPDATSVGYAKFGWNTTADEYVRNEASVLATLASDTAGTSRAMRAPALLTHLEQGGRPVTVVAPLPADVRGARGSTAMPSAAEFYALAPVVRTAPAGETGHLTALVARLTALSSQGVVGSSGPLLDEALELARLVADDSRSVPVQARWHGDLTPWNCARQGDGQLWAWDWESSEPDVVAGLDVLHWHVSVAREAGRWEHLRLAECVGAARAHLAAAGLAASATPVVQAVYALTVVERAATLAARDGGWDGVWTQPVRLSELVREARAALTARR